MSHETNLEETRKALDAHKQVWLGGRVMRRISGNYPSLATRRALAAHERETRKPYEKIRDSIKNAQHNVDRHNQTMNIYNLGMGKVRTASKVDKTIMATEAMAFTYPPAKKLVAGLCAAGGRPELLDDEALSGQGFYVPRGELNDDEVFGIYLTDRSEVRVEKIPFSVESFEAMSPELQHETIDEAQGYADEARIRVQFNPANFI